MNKIPEQFMSKELEKDFNIEIMNSVHILNKLMAIGSIHSCAIKINITKNEQYFFEKDFKKVQCLNQSQSGIL